MENKKKYTEKKSLYFKDNLRFLMKVLSDFFWS